jgi:hypothetical protein
MNGPLGKDLSIVFEGRSLNKVEIHYTMSEKELLAILSD